MFDPPGPSKRWIAILDGRLQSFDIPTGHETWSVAYPGFASPDSSESETLTKIDGRHVVVTTKTAVTFISPA
ncbi:hypothetical protein [Gordonia sp. NPDC058843]|uniref:hypothetical protein n=1 Tax=Gordonia sp. NPDC058843 TaxID=3346648 RepID=UPI0036BB586A